MLALYYRPKKYTLSQTIHNRSEDSLAYLDRHFSTEINALANPVG